ncbi:unnamed protein product [Choristocarpus tenellus]
MWLLVVGYPLCGMPASKTSTHLTVLEPTPEGLKTALHLREVFSMMVSHQLQRTGIPRFVDRKAKTLNRKATPPRGQ